MVFLVPAVKYPLGTPSDDFESSEDLGDVGLGGMPEDLPPLFRAAWDGNLTVVRRAVDQGVDVNAIFTGGLDDGDDPFESCYATLLWCAARKGHLKVVQFLTEQGAGVEAQTPQNVTEIVGPDMGLLSPLAGAAAHGHLEVVRHLASCGAQIDAWDGIGTPLMEAAHNGHLEVVKYLVNQGANVNGHAPFTALHWALSGTYPSGGRSLDTARYLAAHGARLYGDLGFTCSTITVLTVMIAFSYGWAALKFGKRVGFLVESDVHVSVGGHLQALRKLFLVALIDEVLWRALLLRFVDWGLALTIPYFDMRAVILMPLLSVAYAASRFPLAQIAQVNISGCPRLPGAFTFADSRLVILASALAFPLNILCYYGSNTLFSRSNVLCIAHCVVVHMLAVVIWKQRYGGDMLLQPHSLDSQSESGLEAGDHIFRARTFGVVGLAHHGIYVSQYVLQGGEVVFDDNEVPSVIETATVAVGRDSSIWQRHWRRCFPETTVVRCSFEHFRTGGLDSLRCCRGSIAADAETHLFVRRYNQPERELGQLQHMGAAQPMRTRRDVRDLALRQLGNSYSYSVLSRNCESFAAWCAYGPAGSELGSSSTLQGEQVHSCLRNLVRAEVRYLLFLGILFPFLVLASLYPLYMIKIYMFPRAGQLDLALAVHFGVLLAGVPIALLGGADRIGLPVAPRVFEDFELHPNSVVESEVLLGQYQQV